jgi:hypothetical protein
MERWPRRAGKGEGLRRVEVSNSGDAQAARGGYATSGVHIGDVNLMTGVAVRTRYRQQVERIVPPALMGREPELAELAEFCTSASSAGGYRWWRAEAWSGKSALLSWFVLHPPPGVRIVSFFITARWASQNDQAAFIENTLEQLVTLLDTDLPPFLTETTREAHMLGLLTEAAEACRDRQEQFVLVVDGLDEDRGVTTGPDAHSIAALLPACPPAGMRVIVAGRPNPPIPSDVPQDHPLRDPAIVRALTPSPQAQVVRAEMERELKSLLHGTQSQQDLLGVLTAAGGGLKAADLAELTGLSPWDVDDHLRTVTGRTFARRDSPYHPGTEVYLLGHEELQVTAHTVLGPARLDEYRQRLHTWAERYRHHHWPPTTPEYLLGGYYHMLTATSDLSRMISCATNPARQDRMLELTGGDAAALTEITTAQHTLLTHERPDLTAMVRLAIHRDHLTDRNSAIPPDLPAIWVTLGRPNRAEALARSITHPESQSRALVLVAGALAKAGERERAADVLGQAETLARSITHPESQSRALHPLAMTPDPHRAKRSIVRILTLDRWETALDALAHIRSDALTVIDSELAIVAQRGQHRCGHATHNPDYSQRQCAPPPSTDSRT